MFHKMLSYLSIYYLNEQRFDLIASAGAGSSLETRASNEP